MNGIGKGVGIRAIRLCSCKELKMLSCAVLIFRFNTLYFLR